MKVISAWTVRPGQFKEAARRFLAGVKVPAGATLLGRWHKSDGSGGWALYETNDPVGLYEGATAWADVVEFHSSLVIEDAEAGPVLFKTYGQ